MSGYWIWGRRPVLEALRAGTADRILVATGRAPSGVLREIREQASRCGVPVEEVDPQRMAGLAPGGRPQGIAAFVELRSAGSLEELLRTATSAVPFLLVLDQVQDPHNLGALLRTANAAGVQGVVVPERHSASAQGIVAKTSAGAVSYTPVVRVTNLARALDEIKRAGIWTAGLDGGATTSVFEADLSVPLALVIGGEGTGLRRLTRERCDLLLHIPMMGAVQSLNASVAGAIAMYESLRQRLTRDGPPDVE